MLVIRLSRVGRKKLPHYRVIVQEKHVSPKRGKVVERLGDFNPLSKELNVDKDRIKHYLKNGAQPSNRVAKILKKNKFKLPDWVTIEKKHKKPKSEPEEDDEGKKTETEDESKDADGDGEQETKNKKKKNKEDEEKDEEETKKDEENKDDSSSQTSDEDSKDSENKEE